MLYQVDFLYLSGMVRHSKKHLIINLYVVELFLQIFLPECNSIFLLLIAVKILNIKYRLTI